MSPNGLQSQRVIVLIPVFNDWAALALLLKNLSTVAGRLPMPVSVLAVDDGSTVPHGTGFTREDLPSFASLRILHLRRNLGHQRALATGLVYVQQNMPCSTVAVMDGDGEDLPEHVPVLLKEFETGRQREVVFAARAKRLDSPAFRFFYQAYRLLHLLLVGLPVRMGNFSVVSIEALERLVVCTELWNHYAAAVVRSQLPFRTIALPRGKRLAGVSKMNFAALLVHGVSALSVFGDIVSARLLAASATGLVTACVTLLIALVVRLTTSQAIPMWATYTAGIATVILILLVIVSFILILSILASRTYMTFLPARDCPHFFGPVEKVFGND